MKYQLEFSLHPVGCCFLCAVRAVGVEDRGRTYECQALYAAMCGLRSPLVLPFRWRRGREKHIGFTLLLGDKNLTFNGEFLTFTDWCLWFSKWVLLSSFTSKRREELGKLWLNKNTLLHLEEQAIAVISIKPWASPFKGKPTGRKVEEEMLGAEKGLTNRPVRANIATNHQCAYSGGCICFS